MILILKKALQFYWFLFDELPDPRTKSWTLVAKPYQVLTLVALYLMFVIKWGPQWMKNRKPFNLDRILIAYNALQVLICLYLFVHSLEAGWLRDYKWLCEPVDFAATPKAINIASLVYLYYIIKIIDLLDTIFFVLRKKNRQVSFLHIYHHAGMVMLTWGTVTYMPGGHGTLVGVINAFVHMAMYTYYLLTVATPSIKNTRWVKKFITQLQILQFFWCVLHMGALVFKTDCEYPRWTAAVFLPQNIFMLVLFIDFYIKTYIRVNNSKSSVPIKISNGVTEYSNQYRNKTNNSSNELTAKIINRNLNQDHMNIDDKFVSFSSYCSNIDSKNGKSVCINGKYNKMGKEKLV